MFPWQMTVAEQLGCNSLVMFASHDNRTHTSFLMVRPVAVCLAYFGSHLWWCLHPCPTCGGLPAYCGVTLCAPTFGGVPCVPAFGGVTALRDVHITLPHLWWCVPAFGGVTSLRGVCTMFSHLWWCSIMGLGPRASARAPAFGRGPLSLACG